MPLTNNRQNMSVLCCTRTRHTAGFPAVQTNKKAGSTRHQQGQSQEIEFSNVLLQRHPFVGIQIEVEE